MQTSLYDDIAGWAGFGKALAALSLGVRQHSGFNFFFIVCLSFKTAKFISMNVSVSLR